MANQLDFIIQSFTTYVDGFGKAGTGERCTLPKLKKKEETFRGGGMLAARRIGMGYEAFGLRFSLSSFDPQVLGKGGLFVGNKSWPFSVRGYMDGDNNAQHTVYMTMRGEVMELDPGEWQGGGKAMLGVDVALAALKLVIDGTPIWDVDVENGVYNVGGTDAYTAVRAALGRLTMAEPVNLDAGGSWGRDEEDLLHPFIFAGVTYTTFSFRVPNGSDIDRYWKNPKAGLRELAGQLSELDDKVFDAMHGTDYARSMARVGKYANGSPRNLADVLDEIGLAFPYARETVLGYPLPEILRLHDRAKLHLKALYRLV